MKSTVDCAPRIAATCQSCKVFLSVGTVLYRMRVMGFLLERPPYVKRSLSRMASATHCVTLPERCAHRLYEPISHNTQWVALSVVTDLRRRDMSTASRKFDTVQRRVLALASWTAAHDQCMTSVGPRRAPSVRRYVVEHHYPTRQRRGPSRLHAKPR